MYNLIFMLTFILMMVNPSANNDITGVWKTGRNNTRVKIYRKNNAMYGKILSSDNPQAPIGKDVLENLTRDGENWKGSMYSWKKDKWVEVTLEPNGDMLKFKINVGVFPVRFEWKREKR